MWSLVGAGLRLNFFGGKSRKIECLLQQAEDTSKLNFGEKLKKRIFAPTGRKEKQAGLGQRDRKQDIYSNKKKRREKQVGVTKQKKKNCSNKRNI